ncbi:hypothetical protein predicted by Glimmer/Critica [Erwinia amylovora CFBP1430]|uniref:Uncharacterized protein n=1 Tax=Erwinia amylovora (strain CFBP1430) TaxID=665029 RepID=D4HW25_ERWAC|nr:hypothetical protein predicted by Glimmer/Critica [Erwinia amylovora CFBP1430]
MAEQGMENAVVSQAVSTSTAFQAMHANGGYH